MSQAETIECPFCEETINKTAPVCPSCATIVRKTGHGPFAKLALWLFWGVITAVVIWIWFNTKANGTAITVWEGISLLALVS